MQNNWGAMLSLSSGGTYRGLPGQSRQPVEVLVMHLAVSHAADGRAVRRLRRRAPQALAAPAGVAFVADHAGGVVAVEARVDPSLSTGGFR